MYGCVVPFDRDPGIRPGTASGDLETSDRHVLGVDGHDVPVPVPPDLGGIWTGSGHEDRYIHGRFLIVRAGCDDNDPSVHRAVECVLDLLVWPFPGPIAPRICIVIDESHDVLLPGPGIEGDKVRNVVSLSAGVRFLVVRSRIVTPPVPGSIRLTFRLNPEIGVILDGTVVNLRVGVAPYIDAHRVSHDVGMFDGAVPPGGKSNTILIIITTRGICHRHVICIRFEVDPRSGVSETGEPFERVVLRIPQVHPVLVV